MKTKVTLTGTKKDGYVLAVDDKKSYQDIAVTGEELVIIRDLINKKIK